MKEEVDSAILRQVIRRALQDIYGIESEVLAKLPRVMAAAKNDTIRRVLKHHLQETALQAARIEKLAPLVDVSGFEKSRFPPVEALFDECLSRMLFAAGEDPRLNTVAVEYCLKIEHLEIASYQFACAVADALREAEIISALQQSLDEELATANKLLAIANFILFPSGEKGSIRAVDIPSGERPGTLGASGNGSLN